MGKNSSKEKGAAGGSHGFNDELLHDKDSAHIKGYKPVRPRRFVDVRLLPPVVFFFFFF